MLGPLERMIEVSPFNGTQQSRVSLPSPEDGNRSSFRKDVLSSYLEFRMMDKVQKPSNSEDRRRVGYI
jgi:hypothetical protein